MVYKTTILGKGERRTEGIMGSQDDHYGKACALEEGSEFLLVFDSGDFNEDDTFLVTDWLAHTPKEEIAKDPNVSISDLQSLPSSELYTFPGQVPNTTPDASLPTSPNGLINPGFSLHASQVPYTNLAGGQVKIIDSHSFPVAKTIAMAEVIIQPSAMRELHWHPNSAEWNYFISGFARITVFAARGNARTFDYHAGDVGYIPQSNGQMSTSS